MHPAVFGPSADEVPPFKVLDQGLRSCQADQDSRVKGAAQAGLWRPILDIPGRRSVNRRYRELGFFESLDHGGEWLPNLAGKAESCWDNQS